VYFLTLPPYAPTPTPHVLILCKPHVPISRTLLHSPSHPPTTPTLPSRPRNTDEGSAGQSTTSFPHPTNDSPHPPQFSAHMSRPSPSYAAPTPLSCPNTSLVPQHLSRAPTPFAPHHPRPTSLHHFHLYIPRPQPNSTAGRVVFYLNLAHSYHSTSHPSASTPALTLTTLHHTNFRSFPPFLLTPCPPHHLICTSPSSPTSLSHPPPPVIPPCPILCQPVPCSLTFFISPIRNSTVCRVRFFTQLYHLFTRNLRVISIKIL